MNSAAVGGDGVHSPDFDFRMGTGGTRLSIRARRAGLAVARDRRVDHAFGGLRNTNAARSRFAEKGADLVLADAR